MRKYELTLCWKCENTNRFKCSWFDPNDPQPVPGWVAEPSVNRFGTQSYTVKACPNFKPMEKEPRQPADPKQGTPGKHRSGITGVCYRAGKWEANVYRDGRRFYLGMYDTVEEAAAVRADFLKQYEANKQSGTPCTIDRRKRT